MAVSTKFILRSQSTLSDSNFPIMVQIIIDRKNQLVSTKKYSTKEQWQSREQSVSRSHPKHKEINLLLRTIASEIDFFIISEGKKGNRPGFEEIKDLVRNLTGGHTEPERRKLFVLFDEQIESLKKQDRIGYSDTFKSTLGSLKNFMGDKDRELLSINTAFLLRYEAYLVERGCAITTRSVYFRTFRTLWKNAIRDKCCPESHYPFKDFPFAKYNKPRTKKRAITKAQIDLIASKVIEPVDDLLINSRNYFMFSYYCRGINFIDLGTLKWTNIIEDELYYIRAKTKEEFRFRLHPEAIKILDYYKGLEGNSDAGYVFPIIYKRHATLQSVRDRLQKVRTRVNREIKELAKSLGIQKPVTTYVARHSYATVLRRNGVSKENIGRSLGHDSLKTTDIYLEDIGDPVLDDLINDTL